MMTDARTFSAGQIIEADICIVGAGAAGITLAREFIKTDIRVILLESGGTKFSHPTQFLYRGEIAGRNFTPLDFTRRRQFGGSTATWSGRCRPLERSDFEVREWIPHSGWPFSLSDLLPYYKRANELLELGDYQYDSAFWDAQEKYHGLGGAKHIETKIFHFSPPTRFGERYRRELELAQNIHVVLNANALHIQLQQDGSLVNSIRCATLRNKPFNVKAKLFVLGLGGLETARLMLVSKDIHSYGVGNQHDVLGRYFMDHVDFFDGVVLNAPGNLPASFFKLNYSIPMKNLGMVRAIGITDEYRQKHKLLNACAFFVKRPAYKIDDRFFSSAMQDFIQISETLRHATAPSLKVVGSLWRSIFHGRSLIPMIWQMLARKAGPYYFGVQIQLECIPNSESRVTLSEQKDALGMNRIKLNWQLTQQDLESYHHFREVIFSELQYLGFEIRKINHDLDSEGWPVSIVPAKHHSGTTRMSEDPQQGVVDENCKVHGVSNLFIAGSSVFPTSGMANPTLTIVALAVRLADHIKRSVLA